MHVLNHGWLSAMLLAAGCGSASAPPPTLPIASASATSQEHSTPADTDSDGDRIIDRCDECIQEAETYNGIEDEDGCPDRGEVLLSDSRLAILDKIFFEPNSATITSEARPILDAVAATLLGNPQISLLGIVGHTAARERRPHELATARAAGVRDALAQRGVDLARMSTFESGSNHPLSPTDVASNRRVEFQIMRTNDTEIATWDGTQMVEQTPPPQPAPADSGPLVMHRVPLTDAARANCERPWAQ